MCCSALVLDSYSLGYSSSKPSEDLHSFILGPHLALGSCVDPPGTCGDYKAEGFKIRLFHCQRVWLFFSLTVQLSFQ